MEQSRPSIPVKDGASATSMSNPKPSRLLAEERRREIVKVIDKTGRITVDEVVRKFDVSAATARADLDTLSEAGDLVRSHGGGIRALTAIPEHPLKVREGMHRDEKARIASAALQLIQPMQTVILGTGSTSGELARQLFHKCPPNVTIITHALNVALRLADLPHASLVMLGGFLRQPSTAFVGPHAEHMMSSLHADHCFLSVVGLDAEAGLTTLDIMEAHLNRRMIQASKQVTVLADSSKFGQRSLSVVSDFRPIHRVITDTHAPAADVQDLRARGIEVILA